MKKIFFLALAIPALCASAQDVPLVYNVENTAAGNADPVFPTFEQLPYCEPLTDPLLSSDGTTRALDFKDWSKRRGEIAREIQHYEIGDKPIVPMDSIEATLEGNVLTVTTSMNGEKLTQTATINYPEGGTAPYPLMIGADNISLPSSMMSERNIATMNFTANQVNGYSQFGGSTARDFERLYPNLNTNGAYSEWAWGFSRLLDGLQKLGTEVTKIDMNRIGVTGCSYAGKMALFCGAFDERVALTIAQESGGGGTAAWRVTRVHNAYFTKEDAWEGLDNTDYSWFMKSLKSTFGQDNTFYLPYDHHELVALCCPRAILMLGNPDYKWLADGSGYVSMNAARKVWEQYGIADRCGYSIVGGHSHCSLPESQYEEVEAFLDKFLLGKTDVETNYTKAPYYSDATQAGATTLVELSQWTRWWGTGKPDSLDCMEKVLPAFCWGKPADINPNNSTDFALESNEDSYTKNHLRALNTNKECPTNPAQALNFTFNVDKQQDYYIYAYVNCAKSANDAFFIAFDDNTPCVSNGASTKGAWAWKSLSALLSKADKTSFVKNLAVGQHTLKIYNKEPEAKIGFICVSNCESLNDFKDAIKDIDFASLSGIAQTKMQNGNLLQSVSAADGGVKVVFNAAQAFEGTVEIYNLIGGKVAEKSANIPAGLHEVTVPASLQKGNMIVHVTDSKGATATKIFVVK